MVQLTNSSGTVVCDYTYDAFGNGSYTGSVTSPFRYCGEYRDNETGLIYLRNRYYNPSTGRFINEDPIRSGGNWYSYCDNNPLKFIDQLGLAPEDGTLRTWVNNRTEQISYIESEIKWDPKTSTATVTISNTNTNTSKTASFTDGKDGVYISSKNNRMYVSNEKLWQTFGTILDPPLEVNKARDIAVLTGLFVGVARAGKFIATIVEESSPEIIFGSATKSAEKLANEMAKRGWTKESVLQTIKSPFTTRVSKNLATNNPATAYYTKEGAYVVVDDITKEVVQVSDAINPQTWIVDKNIVDPYIPK